MNRILKLHGAALCLFGLACAIAPSGDFSLWRRIAGLHLAAMGAYLHLLSASPDRKLLRDLMSARVVLGAAEIALGVKSRAPLFIALGVLDLVVADLLRRGFGDAASSPSQAPPHSLFRRAHDLLLQVPPSVEGLVGVFAPALSARLLFGAEAASVDAWLPFSALQSSYLAAYWWQITRADARRAILATAWGRAFVACSFLVFVGTGVAPMGSFLPFLAAGLLLSVGWTLVAES